MRPGAVESPWGRLVGGLVLGTETFARQPLRGVGGNSREQAALKSLVRPVAWSEIISALELAKGEGWAQFSRRLENEARLRRELHRIELQLSNVEM